MISESQQTHFFKIALYIKQRPQNVFSHFKAAIGSFHVNRHTCFNMKHRFSSGNVLDIDSD